MKFLQNSKVIAYIFYVLAILFCLYTIFTMVTTIQYLSSVVSSGMYAGVAFSDMMTAFVGQVGPYLFYTFVFFFCGYAIQLLAGEINTKKTEEVKSDAIEPASSYSGTLETTTEAEPVEETVEVEEEEPVAVIDDLEKDREEIPVIENDSDLTDEKLDELEEGIEEFDEKETKSDETDDIGL